VPRSGRVKLHFQYPTCTYCKVPILLSHETAFLRSNVLTIPFIKKVSNFMEAHEHPLVRCLIASQICVSVDLGITECCRGLSLNNKTVYLLLHPHDRTSLRPMLNYRSSEQQPLDRSIVRNWIQNSYNLSNWKELTVFIETMLRYSVILRLQAVDITNACLAVSYSQCCHQLT
jgi:hypothetical protein